MLNTTSRPGIRRVSLVLLVAVLVSVLFYLWHAYQSISYVGPQAQDYLDAHWTHPIPPQGHPPEAFSGLERSLDAQSCGTCHGAQYQDWQASRHSHTMNAGIRWQFHVFSPAESIKCMNCHAPLAEQKALAAMELGWENAPSTPPPDFIPPNFHKQGLNCATCHVRGHERHGPEHRAGLTGEEPGLPHAGFRARAEFSDSRFCASCHQFAEGGPRLNGKLRQDTYQEWRRSRYAEQDISCQSCHMPDRRHTWRGISDPQMLRQALGLRLVQSEDGEQLQLTLSNQGAGHHLPTYMVPRIDVRLLLLDPQGRAREQLIHHVIQWRSDVHITEELFDHRIPSGESVVLAESWQPPAEAGWSLGLLVDVAPKEHYERMYQDMLRQADKMTPITLDLLQLAIVEARASRYQAIAERISLDAPLNFQLPASAQP